MDRNRFAKWSVAFTTVSVLLLVTPMSASAQSLFADDRSAVAGESDASPAEAAAGEVQIAVGKTISLKAREVPLHKILVAISEAAQVELRSRGAAIEDPVSLAIEARDWRALLSQVLDRTSYVLSFDATTGRPTYLAVFWDQVRHAPGAAAAPAGPEDDVERRIREAATTVLAPRDHAGEAIERLAAAEEAFLAAEAALLEARAAGDGRAGEFADAYDEAREAYLSAIQSQAAHDEPRTVEALLPGMEIDDREIRLTTLETMRWLSATGGNPNAVAAATEAFHGAEDAAAERAALEVLVRYGDEREVLKILEPLALNDGPNRDLAVREWLRIRDERNARQGTASD